MLTKERVFQIMGKFYGNCYYRTAIQRNFSENDLQITVNLLDAVNALGYNFCNLQRLMTTEDVRFVPIILEHLPQYESITFKGALILAIRFSSYSKYVPQLLEIYRTCEAKEIREFVSEALFSIADKKYISEYLGIIYNDSYGHERDYIIDLLCSLKVYEALPKLLELHKADAVMWSWTFLKYAAIFRDKSLIPLIEPYVLSSDYEKRRLARNALSILQSE